MVRKWKWSLLTYYYGDVGGGTLIIRKERLYIYIYMYFYVSLCKCRYGRGRSDPHRGILDGTYRCNVRHGQDSLQGDYIGTAEGLH